MSRLLVVGASERALCGVRDHASILNEQLAASGLEVERVWWEHESASIDEWLDAIRAAAQRARPDWILWHYSIGAYSHRGLPVRAPGVARELASSGVPLAVFVHEYGVPFSGRGWRGFVQAAAQRLAFVYVARASSACLVTVEGRRRLFAGSGWLPRRPVAFAPVFSNLGPATETRLESPPTIGVFGFGHAIGHAALTARALARVRASLGDCRLLLLGAPGADSPEGEAWLRAAEEAGCEELLAFTGLLGAPDLAAALASAHVVLFADPAGPSTRKGTLAASLAAGKAIVAIDGPDAWPEFARAGALVLVPPSEQVVAAALERLLTSREAREEQGRRAAELYDRRLAPGHSAAAVLTLLADDGGGRGTIPVGSA